MPIKENNPASFWGLGILRRWLLNGSWTFFTPEWRQHA